jgi:hypothetical protein
LAIVLIASISGISSANDTSKITPAETRKGLVKSCMRAMENNEYCNCVVNAIQKHVPAEHVNHHQDGSVMLSPDLPDEFREKLFPDAKKCHGKHIGDSTG